MTPTLHIQLQIELINDAKFPVHESLLLKRKPDRPQYHFKQRNKHV
jgi:hypothetical protein